MWKEKIYPSKSFVFEPYSEDYPFWPPKTSLNRKDDYGKYIFANERYIFHLKKYIFRNPKYIFYVDNIIYKNMIFTNFFFYKMKIQTKINDFINMIILKIPQKI